MTKYNRNTGKAWSDSQENQLEKLAAKNTPTRVIGLILGRTGGAVRTEANKLGVSLKPSNQSPYTKRRK